MAPRKRDKRNSNLTGTNIKKMTKSGKDYFYYQMPDGSLAPLAHGNEKASVEAAHALNRALRPSGSIVERVLARPPKPVLRNPLVVDVIDQFQQDWVLQQDYSKTTLQTRIQKLNAYRREWPHKRIGDLDTFTIAQYLRQFSPESARHHRNVLEPLFRFAASEGYETQRPMADIERRKVTGRKRARHTWDGHYAIYQASPEWLQRAILIALYSLQRRADLVAINIKDQINLEERTIRVLQQKSRNYDQPVFIEITMGDDLFDVVTRAIRSDVPCPFLIHYRPIRIKASDRAAKLHPFAVTPGYLSKAYAKVRDSVGVYNHLPPVQRPGIHSLRALGIWLYHKAGYSDDYIMALAGHANERMTAHYAEGHERKAPVKVSAGLSLDKINMSNIDWETDLSKPLLKLADSSAQ